MLKEWFLSLVVGVVLAMAVGLVEAQTPPSQTAGVTIVGPPTKWQSGAPITSPISYNIYRGSCGGAKTKVGSVAAGSLTTQVSGSTPGQCFTASAVVDGSESLQTSEAVYNGTPQAPGGLTIVTITIAVQGAVQSLKVEQAAGLKAGEAERMSGEAEQAAKLASRSSARSE